MNNLRGSAYIGILKIGNWGRENWKMNADESADKTQAMALLVAMNCTFEEMHGGGC